MLNLVGFGYKSDPFPLVPESSVYHWAGREETQRELMDVIESVRVSDVGTSEFVILHGTYGAGKSHALRYLATQINDVQAAEFRSRAIYVPTIRVDQKVTFVGLYQTIIGQFGPDSLLRLASEIHARLNVAENGLKETLPRPELLQLMQTPNGVRSRVFDGLDKEDRPIIRLLDEIAKNNAGDAYKFVNCGGKALPELGFTTAIDTDFAATRVLGGLFRAMTIEIAGQEPPSLGAYLFLDEFEAIMDMKVTESGPILNSLRELVNQVPYHLCLLLSFSADTALIEAVVPQALIQRLSREYIEFPPLQADEAKQFLRKHFLAYRPEGFANPNEFHPFEEATIEAVLEQITEMTPRNMFRKLRTVLERAVKRHQLQPGDEIDPGLAEQILTP